MDLDFDDETLTFQQEVREFLSSHRDSFPTLSYDTAEGLEQHRHWDKVLFDAGLSVITWPEKYGGRDATLLQWVVFEEEYFRAGAPGRASANGTSMLAPTLFAHGTEEQLDRILPKMASGEQIWAQAWSEPESGSDLASLRSTATKTDGGWLLNGQKIWSSRAPFAEMGFGLFRSDPAAERHNGLTYFMFDLKTKGVTVRPIVQLGGDTGFGEIFLDDVTVSRRHAEFRLESDEFHVVDVGSLNGTYVNREPVDSAVLANGDEVQIGKFRLVFLTGPKVGDDGGPGS